jgi:hypothetical protein
MRMAMRRLCLILFTVCLLLTAGPGCTAEDKRQWREALSDLRGDNMEMGSHDHKPP